jgi:hypothetical protein
VQVAAQLTQRTALGTAERTRARARYEQLYWADLPFAGESAPVIGVMRRFREKLLEAEAAPDDQTTWNELNTALIELARVLSEETPAHQERRDKSPPG